MNSCAQQFSDGIKSTCFKEKKKKKYSVYLVDLLNYLRATFSCRDVPRRFTNLKRCRVMESASPTPSLYKLLYPRGTSCTYTIHWYTCIIYTTIIWYRAMSSQSYRVYKQNVYYFLFYNGTIGRFKGTNCYDNTKPSVAYTYYYYNNQIARVRNARVTCQMPSRLHKIQLKNRNSYAHRFRLRAT